MAGSKKCSRKYKKEIYEISSARENAAASASEQRQQSGLQSKSTRQTRESDITESLCGCSSANSFTGSNSISEVSSAESTEVSLDIDDDSCTTPRADEYQIPRALPCPPAPRKPRVSSRFRSVPAADFFIPPDLDSLLSPRSKKISVDV